MKALISLIKSNFTVRSIDLTNKQWHQGISNKSGWYFVETDAPLSAFITLPSPPSEYTNEDGEVKKCRNYDIPARANSLASALGEESIVISRKGLKPVYSGMAKNLLNRAREHTFAHEGTAGLALKNYPTLFSYEWNFHYIENAMPHTSLAHRDVTLKLGEQVWRGIHGWPLLCSG